MMVKSACFNAICDVIYKCLKSKAEIKVSYKACRHIWLKHGSYENAKFYFASGQGKGRIPSHYFDHCILIQAIIETLHREIELQQQKISRFTKTTSFPKRMLRLSDLHHCPHMTKWHLLKYSRKCDALADRLAFNKPLGRLLYLKQFLFPIGRAGLITPNSEYGKEVNCCGVVVDVHKGLVTSYPAESFNNFKAQSGFSKEKKTFKQKLANWQGGRVCAYGILGRCQRLERWLVDQAPGWAVFLKGINGAKDGATFYPLGPVPWCSCRARARSDVVNLAARTLAIRFFVQTSGRGANVSAVIVGEPPLLHNRQATGQLVSQSKKAIMKKRVVLFLAIAVLAVVGFSDQSRQPYLRFPFLKRLLNAKEHSSDHERDSPLTGDQRIGVTFSQQETIQRLLETRCDRDGIEIILDHNNRIGLLSMAFEKAMSKSALILESVNASNMEECQDVDFSRGVDSLRLAFAYNNTCVTRKNVPTDRNDSSVNGSNVTYKMKVALQPHNNDSVLDQRYSFVLHCVLPDKRKDPRVEHDIYLYKSKTERTPVSRMQEAELGTTMFIQGKARSSWYSGSNIHSYPMNCWINQESGGFEQRIYFIKHGCPASNTRGYGLCRVHHFNDDSPKIGLELNRNLIPYFSEQSNQSLTISCEFFPCSLKLTEFLWLIPKCPPFHACTGETLANSSRIAVTMTKVAVVQSVRLALVPPRKTKGSDDEDCSVQCLKTDQLDQPNGTGEGSGVNGYVAVGVMLVSFFAGMTVAAILWLRRSRQSEDRFHDFFEFTMILSIPKVIEQVQKRELDSILNDIQADYPKDQTTANFSKPDLKKPCDAQQAQESLLPVLL
ncbi:hypothetical protein TTRE_0000479701 [Trichuris trichiura]|uniref:Uncharacterized protein n=1 Tax=Trichuris trichiura TaxID=36087 RepID=A0A077Z7P4_TRITR|nr:hypothetical protein TTRE_0000479701 [Trichuris trichiura]